MKNEELMHLDITIIWNWLVSLKNYIYFTLDFKLENILFINTTNLSKM